jgi:hypothetical protein
METATPTPTIEHLSQELVDLTRSIKANEQRVTDIKRQITFPAGRHRGSHQIF